MCALAIFTRLSKEDLESNSISNQLREGKQFAKKNGYSNYIHYNEGEGVSGGREIEDRPELNLLIKDIIDGKITAVWLRNQNRLERNGYTYESFIRIVRKYKTKVYFGNKLFDLDDPSESLMGGITSLINAHKIQLQSYQTKRALKDNANEGGKGGHSDPPRADESEHSKLSA